MQTSIDTNLWKSISWSEDPEKLVKQLQEFSFKLSQWCAAINQALANPAAILQLLNAAAGLSWSASKQLIANITLAGGTFVQACDDYSSVVLNGNFSAIGTSVVSLTHLANGVPVVIFLQNGSGGAANLNFAGSTQPNGTAYSSFSGVETGAVGFQTVIPCASLKGVIAHVVGFGSSLFGAIMTTA